MLSALSLTISSAPPSPMPDQHHQRAGSPLGSPAPGGYFEHNNQLSAGPTYHDRFSKDKRQLNRTSAESFYDEEPQASPLYYEDQHKRRSGGKKFFAGGYDDEDAPSTIGSSDQGDTTVVGSNHGRDPAAAPGYDNFLAAANKQFAKNSGGRNAPDPYFDPRQSMDGGAPSRPFTTHSRGSSFDSISSIVDEKGASSPMNKVMETFTDSDGEVAQNFVQKLRDLTADNSKGDLCIEKFLMRSEKDFFKEVKKEKMSGEYCLGLWGLANRVQR